MIIKTKIMSSIWVGVKVVANIHDKQILKFFEYKFYIAFAHLFSLLKFSEKKTEFFGFFLITSIHNYQQQLYKLRKHHHLLLIDQSYVQIALFCLPEQVPYF